MDVGRTEAEAEAEEVWVFIVDYCGAKKRGEECEEH